MITWDELRVGAVRRGAEAERMPGAFRAAVIDRIIEVDEATAESAAPLRASDPTIRTPDALVIATAREAGVGALLTANRKFTDIAPELVEPLRPN